MTASNPHGRYYEVVFVSPSVLMDEMKGCLAGKKVEMIDMSKVAGKFVRGTRGNIVSF